MLDDNFSSAFNQISVIFMNLQSSVPNDVKAHSVHKLSAIEDDLLAISHNLKLLFSYMQTAMSNLFF